MGSYDCTVSSDSTWAEVLADLNRFITAITGEEQGARKWIASLDHGQNLTDQLNTFKPIWSNVSCVDIGSLGESDLSLNDIQVIVNGIRNTIKSLNLDPKPLSCVSTEFGNAAFDIVAIEAYADPPGTGDRNAILSTLRSRLDKEVAALNGKPFMIIPMGYSRNYDFADLGNNEAVLLDGFKYAYEHKPQCIGVCTFSWARASGSRELGLGDFLIRGRSIYTGADTGDPEPIATYVPPAPIVGPGFIWSQRVNDVFPAGSATVDIAWLRKDGSKGEVSVPWTLTQSTSGDDCILQQSIGILTFADGQIGSIITVPIPPATGKGRRVWRMLLDIANAKGGVQFVDRGKWITVQSADNSINIAPVSCVVLPGNPVGALLVRDGDLSQPITGHWQLVKGTGVWDRDFAKGPGWNQAGEFSFAAGQAIYGIAAALVTLPTALLGATWVVKILDSTAPIGRTSECLITVQ